MIGAILLGNSKLYAHIYILYVWWRFWRDFSKSKIWNSILLIRDLWIDCDWKWSDDNAAILICNFIKHAYLLYGDAEQMVSFCENLNQMFAVAVLILLFCFFYQVWHSIILYMIDLVCKLLLNCIGLKSNSVAGIIAGPFSISILSLIIYLLSSLKISTSYTRNPYTFISAIDKLFSII